MVARAQQKAMERNPDESVARCHRFQTCTPRATMSSRKAHFQMLDGSFGYFCEAHNSAENAWEARSWCLAVSPSWHWASLSSFDGSHGARGGGQATSPAADSGRRCGFDGDASWPQVWLSCGLWAIARALVCAALGPLPLSAVGRLAGLVRPLFACALIGLACCPRVSAQGNDIAAPAGGAARLR